MKTTIYCYSATGNTYAAAKAISQVLEECQILPCDPAGGHPDSAQVGFMFPTFYGGLPRGMETFLRLFPARPDVDYFAVATHGGFPGNALPTVRDILTDAGVGLRYASALRAMSNNIERYPVKVHKAEAARQRMLEGANIIAQEILSGKARRGGPRIPFADRLVSYPEPDADRAFIVNRQACTGCARCVVACPCKNIDLVDRRPLWNGHCDHCLACVQWCPVGAIDLGVRTVARQRYQCPGVELEELPR